MLKNQFSPARAAAAAKAAQAGAGVHPGRFAQEVAAEMGLDLEAVVARHPREQVADREAAAHSRSRWR